MVNKNYSNILLYLYRVHGADRQLLLSSDDNHSDTKTIHHQSMPLVTKHIVVKSQRIYRHILRSSHHDNSHPCHMLYDKYVTMMSIVITLKFRKHFGSTRRVWNDFNDYVMHVRSICSYEQAL